MRTYLMEDDWSASFLTLDQRDDRLEGRIVETTFSAGLAFEAAGSVGGYIRDGRLSILVVSDPGSPEFLFESQGFMEDDRVVLTRSEVGGAFGSVTFKPATETDYHAAIGRIAARARSRNG